MKIIIIGAGLLGVTTAYFLGKKGHEVTVLDRQDGPGKETSFANGGMLTPSQSEPWNSPGICLKLLSWVGKENSPLLIRPRGMMGSFSWGLKFLKNSSQKQFQTNMLKNARLGNYSMEIMQTLSADLNLEFDMSIDGTMKIFREENQLQEVLDWHKHYQSIGLRYRLLNSKEVIDFQPLLADAMGEIVGGIYYPDDGAGDAHKYCVELAKHANTTGTTFLYGSEVESFISEKGYIKAVQTRDEELTADVFIIAAGSFSVKLAGLLGLQLPVRPIKGYSLTVSCDSTTGPTVPIVDESLHTAITPLGNRYRIAGTAEINGYDLSIRKSRIANMFNFLEFNFPEMHRTLRQDHIQEWAGLRPYSVDGVPIIGDSPYGNLYFNTGHGHLGWTLATGSGQLLANKINGEPLEIDLEPYGLDRW